MRKLALVFVGGFCGALARYLLSVPLLALAYHIFPHTAFAVLRDLPFDILFINLTGALALGLLYGLFERGAAISPDMRLALGTGFLGAYTTFSTYMYGADRLLTGGVALVGWLYLLGSVALGVGCARLGYVGAGMYLARRRMFRRTWVYPRRFWRGVARSWDDRLRSDAAGVVTGGDAMDMVGHAQEDAQENEREKEGAWS